MFGRNPEKPNFELSVNQLAEQLVSGEESAVKGVWHSRAEDIVTQAIILLGKRIKKLEEKYSE